MGEMKHKIFYVIFYLLGCFCAYNYTKYNLTHYPDRDKWTKGDRAFSLVLSSLSWGTVFAMGIVHLMEIVASDKEPAKW